jgi:DNA-binding FadR family transcriptional regulator
MSLRDETGAGRGGSPSPRAGKRNGAVSLAAAAKLREMIFAHEDGAYLGSQGEIMARLGVARVTLQQTARLLEQEQLLRVQRGVGGGYYAARPDESAVEKAVATYLRANRSGYEKILPLAGALTAEVLQLAANSPDEAGREALRATQPLIEDPRVLEQHEVLSLGEKRFFEAVFRLADNPFGELMLRVITRLYYLSPVSEAISSNAWAGVWQESRLNMLRAVLARDAHYAQIVARDYFRRIQQAMPDAAAPKG